MVGLTLPKNASIRGSSLNLLRGSDPTEATCPCLPFEVPPATDRDSKAEDHFGHWQKHMGRRTPHEGLRESPGRISLVGDPTPVSITGFFAGHVLHGAPPGSVTPESGAIGEKRPRGAVEDVVANNDELNSAPLTRALLAEEGFDSSLDWSPPQH